MLAEKLRRIRGARIGMVFQDPLSSLHPMYSVGRQIAEAILVHRKVSKDQAWAVARSGWSRSGSPPCGSATIRTSSPAACGNG